MKTIDTTGWPKALDVKKTRNPGVFRAVAINDPHMSTHTPPAYKVEYWPLLMSSEVMQLMRSTSIPQIGIFGNHDIKFGHIEQGLPGQPAELIWTAGVYQLLDETESMFDAGDHRTKIAGSSYIHGQAEVARNKKKDGANWLVTLGHFWFGPETGNFYGEPIFGPDFLGQGETDLYIIGHHHEDQGVQLVNGKQYASVGSLSRTGAHKNDLSRKPAALFIETTKERIETRILRPKVPPAEELMDLVRREQIIKEKAEMTKFIESLRDTQVTTTTDPREVLKELDADFQTKALVETYLDKAEAAAQ